MSSTITRTRRPRAHGKDICDARLSIEIRLAAATDRLGMKTADSGSSWRSLGSTHRRFGRAFHHRGEPAEQITAVARAGRCLRMILDREHRTILDPEPAIRSVEERDVSFLNAFGQALRIDGEAVIHRGDLDLASGQVLHRMIGAVMA